jgi:lantibiotic modifying enzyme
MLLRELQSSDEKTYSTLEKKVMRRIARRGLVCGNLGLETAGMMEGLAGIGLALMKLVDPAGVPNVLILESQRPAEQLSVLKGQHQMARTGLA